MNGRTDSRRSRRSCVGLGHDVIDRTIGLKEVGQATVEARPDVAIVIVGSRLGAPGVAGDRRAREAGGMSRSSPCSDVQDSAFISEAAKRGIFAYIADGNDPEELQSSIDIVLRRFAEYHDLEGAFGRRAVTERAKGILMERHSVDERDGVQHAARPRPPHEPEDGRRGGGDRVDPPAAAGRGRPSASESTRRAGLVSSSAGRSRARCAPARPGASPRSSTARARRRGGRAPGSRGRRR